MNSQPSPSRIRGDPSIGPSAYAFPILFGFPLLISPPSFQQVEGPIAHPDDPTPTHARTRPRASACPPRRCPDQHPREPVECRRSDECQLHGVFAFLQRPVCGLPQRGRQLGRRSRCPQREGKHLSRLEQRHPDGGQPAHEPGRLLPALARPGLPPVPRIQPGQPVLGRQDRPLQPGRRLRPPEHRHHRVHRSDLNCARDGSLRYLPASASDDGGGPFTQRKPTKSLVAIIGASMTSERKRDPFRQLAPRAIAQPGVEKG